MSDEGTCATQVDRGHGMWPHFRPCGRGFKTDEQREAGLCGLHLAAKKRRDAKGSEAAARREASDAAHDRAKAAVVKLNAAGIEAGVHYEAGFTSALGRYTGRVTIDAADALRLLPAPVTVEGEVQGE